MTVGYSATREIEHNGRLLGYWDDRNMTEGYLVTLAIDRNMTEGYSVTGAIGT